ncbi:hypothetical protein ASC95_26540 [Pelomonas sp. Root1217]|uniref:FAD/NAD(P)-binding protein n=1 Tax=Pelomonas sp. Root1217 TaxID=1736430 RepID=UPI00070AE0F0|nr:FAD/NAD(P)-binding protein [Pelomonas sp. Root1217]KQV47066.1 hypothetical protein ASC95_26540 [Pelomonas sp. Root1217]
MKIAIVGGGFVGTAVACQLLQAAPSGSQLTLINAGGQLARGVAYGTRSAAHLLNVPAARMGWDVAAPLDFAESLVRRGLSYAQHDFVPRSLYGNYLGETLQRHIDARCDVGWRHLPASVHDLWRRPDGSWNVVLGDGSSINADCVILALGNFAPACPLADFATLPAHCYAPDPWQSDALAGIDPHARVAIVGSGLTMLDMLVSLDDAGHCGPIFALSRRGLLPQGHRDNELPPHQWRPPAGWPRSEGVVPRSMLRAIRNAVDAARRDDRDWRDIWGAMRAVTPELWRSMSTRDRAQFLRHLQPLWDVHRHRSAPAALARFERLRASGRLTQAAGRLVAARVDEGQVMLEWRARGDETTRTVRAARVINCSGPSSRIRDDRSGLFGTLEAAGRLQPCPLGLGVIVDDRYQLLDAQGQAQPGLFYVGPLLKAQYWEATAVPELRQHAAAAARACLAGMV